MIWQHINFKLKIRFNRAARLNVMFAYTEKLT